MPFDKDCSTYWCDTCEREMKIDYANSSEYGLILKCSDPECEYRRHFVSTTRSGYEEVT